MMQNDVLLIHLTCPRQFLIQDHLEWSIDGQNGSDWSQKLHQSTARHETSTFLPDYPPVSTRYRPNNPKSSWKKHVNLSPVKDIQPRTSFDIHGHLKWPQDLSIQLRTCKPWYPDLKLDPRTDPLTFTTTPGLSNPILNFQDHTRSSRERLGSESVPENPFNLHLFHPKTQDDV